MTMRAVTLFFLLISFEHLAYSASTNEKDIWGLTEAQWSTLRPAKLREIIGSANPQVLSKLINASNAGDSKAMAIMSGIYFNGTGVEKNENESIRLAKASSEKGSGLGSYILGLKYTKGGGLPESEKKSFEYMQMASDQGSKLGSMEVGMRYLTGIGVAKDFDMADKYLKIAMEANIRHAFLVRGYAGYENDGEAKSKFYIQKAADLGSENAKKFLDIIKLQEEIGPKLNKLYLWSVGTSLVGADTVIDYIYHPCSTGLGITKNSQSDAIVIDWTYSVLHASKDGALNVDGGVNFRSRLPELQTKATLSLHKDQMQNTSLLADLINAADLSYDLHKKCQNVSFEPD